MNKEQKALLANGLGCLQFVGDFYYLLSKVKTDNNDLYNDLLAKYEKGGIANIDISYFGNSLKSYVDVITDKDNALLLNQKTIEDKNGLILFCYGVCSFDVKFDNTNKNIKTEKNVYNEISVAIIDFSYDNPIKSITANFYYDMAEPLEIPIVTNKIDKKALLEKQENEARLELLSKANIKHSTGRDLVNIYFDACCDTYFKTEINLYNKFENNYRLMAKYSVEKDCFFKSIGGLAVDTYAYILQQYNTKNEIIIKTDYIEFRINNENNNDSMRVRRDLRRRSPGL